MARYVRPLDPECPHVVQFRKLYENDPRRADAEADFAIHHRQHCLRCAEYGAAHVEIE